MTGAVRGAHDGATAYGPSPMRKPRAPPEPSIIRSTLRALLHPRRLIPIVLLSASLVVAQGSYSRDPFAIPLGIAMCVRVRASSRRCRGGCCSPTAFDLRHGGIRLILYATIGGRRGAGRSASWCPASSGMGRTLLTAPTSVAVCLALFLVGGWGLGRDMWLENSLARAEARATVLAREAEGAQLLALRSHLDPHFLFNTLNAIAEWCREDGETAERAVVRLSAMLRTVLAGVRAATWPLAEELALVDTLFELHRLRDPDRVRVTRGCPIRCPTSRSRRCCCCRWRRTRSSTGRRPATPARSCSPRATAADERLVDLDREPGRVSRAGAPAAAGSKWSSGGWRSPMRSGDADDRRGGRHDTGARWRCRWRPHPPGSPT